MRAYLDSSSANDEHGHDWLTLAGFGAPDRFWKDFDDGWLAMLHARYPMAPYLHMIELLGHDDPFDDPGWDIKTKRALVTDAVQFLMIQDKQQLRLFLCSIDVTARDGIASAGGDIGSPERITASLCIGGLSQWFAELFPAKPESVFIFFDRDDICMADFKKRWLAERTPLGRKVKANPYWDWIENISDADTAYTMGLQAADMVAWATSRHLSPKEREQRDLITLIKTVVPSKSWHLEEEALRSVHLPRHGLVLG